jgi:mannose-6-phosphate isomerase
MRLFAIEPAILRYAWGSPIAIPSLFGWSSDGQPIAELWYGDHPRAPAMLFDGDGPRPLDAAMAADPSLGGALGFLLKVLGAAAPLSLQCHPDAAQAVRGHAAENARGVALDAADRLFPDDRGKAEIVVALGRFEALDGLRDAADLRARFATAGIRALDDLLPADDAGVPGFIAALLRLPPDRRAAALAEARAVAGAASDPVQSWMARLVTRYPQDPAALAPLFLHHVELAAGDALFLQPRRLHAYLGGVALELTGPSDNVVRGGMTTKHVDIGNLLEIADLAPSAPGHLAPTRVGSLRRYAPAGADLRLELGEIDGAIERPASRGAEVIVGLGGLFTVVRGDEELELGAGDACLVAPGEAYRLEGRGRGAIAGAG